jgi:hypothetical protein
MREAKMNKMLVQERAPFPITQSKGKTEANVGSLIKTSYNSRKK